MSRASLVKRETAILVLLTFLSSATCWLPIIISPRLDLPWQVALGSVALSACLASMLNAARWYLFVASATIGTFLGQCAGYALWWPTDGIEASWVPIGVGVTTFLVALTTAITGYLGSKLSTRIEAHKRVAWVFLTSTTALWLIVLAATPPLAAHRIATNERFAVERLTSLQRAADATINTPSTSAQLCDGSALRRNYAGRPFSDLDWKRITGNYVLQDGYMFMVYCQEKRGFTIHAMPKTTGQDGRRCLCTDQSGQRGCGMGGNAWGHWCLPCPKPGASHP